MKKMNNRLLCLLGVLGFLVTPALAQSDSALNRSVTVERDFQPVIQAAGKVATKPAVVETTIEPAPIEYSSFTADVMPSATFHSLLSQPTRFEAGKNYDGYVRGAIGHPNTLFDFGYHLDDGKRSILDVYAHHKAEWGLAALSKTKAGLNFRHPFSTCELYFGLNGGNVFYHKYGHFYDYSQAWGMWEKNKIAYPEPHPFEAKDKTSLWTVEAFFGLRSTPKQEVQYQLQTGYNLFAKPGAVSEHQIRTKAGFDWRGDVHHVGLQAYIQNNFMQLRGKLAAAIPDSLYNSRHNIRLEPYYAYDGQRVRLHVGVNLDMNIGVGKNELSGTENISFAPSPHVNLEAQIAKEWLTVYADATGSFGLGTLQEFMEENRYYLIHAGIINHHVAGYTPVDGEIGFHIRPARGLLLELHGGYAYMLNQIVFVAHSANEAYALPAVNYLKGDFGHEYTTYNRGKVGGQINYHFRDVVRINLNGDYYFWSGSMPVYDRANWDLCLRIDGRIDKHWSLYSENRFEGSRIAKVSNGADYTLRPIIDLNAGVEYNMWVGKLRDVGKSGYRDTGVLKPEPKPNLTLFLQLNNWLHRKNEYLYGYRSQGINFLVGAMFRF